MDKKLLDILVCPLCKGALTYQEKQKKLICKACALSFRIEDDIPIMLVDEAEKLSAEEVDKL
jgi:uncharacterized protein